MHFKILGEDMDCVKIGEKIVGKGKACFIIVDAGVNHNGSLETAEKLVKAAAKTGVDAIKFQAFKAEDLVTGKGNAAKYQEENLGEKVSQQEMLKRYELQEADFERLKRLCDEKGITFLITPHTSQSLDFVNRLAPALKIGSGDLTNLPFLEQAAKKGKPIILATGMGTMEETKQALNAIYNTGNKEVVALHCTTNYPCPIEEVNLNAMKSMQNHLDCIVGYSDHTTGITIPIMAVTLGAKVIEKHFTLDKKMPGPDHKASLEPKELKEMVKNIRKAELALGSYEKKPSKAEKEIAEVARKSLVAKQKIGKGQAIEKEMLAIKRPGTGLKPFELNKVVGKKAKRDILEDEVIEEGMVE